MGAIRLAPTALPAMKPRRVSACWRACPIRLHIVSSTRTEEALSQNLVGQMPSPGVIAKPTVVIGPQTKLVPALRSASVVVSRLHCCDLLSSSRLRTSSDTKRSARCHASSLSPQNWKYFLNTMRWDVVSIATVCANCTSVLIL